MCAPVCQVGSLDWVAHLMQHGARVTSRVPLFACLLSACAAAPVAAETTIQPSAFAQITAENVDNDGIDFGADRVRAAATIDAGAFFGGLVLDFNVGGPDRPVGTLNKEIKDVWAGWRFARNWSIKAGQFKTPIGMDFNTPGARLDITKRALEKPLVLERDTGVMVSARNLGGLLGIDVGVFNPAGRSGATAHTAAQEGEANAYVGRVHLDAGSFHGEIAFALDEQAGGPDTEDYAAVDVGLRYTRAAWTLKAETIRGQNVRGIDEWDSDVTYGHVGYKLSAHCELVARHYAGTSERPGVGQADLGNTYLGLNVWPVVDGPASMRLQANVVLASGDTDAWRGVGGQALGLGGFTDDGVLLQWQVSTP